jgi:hypothetical protein
VGAATATPRTSAAAARFRRDTISTEDPMANASSKKMGAGTQGKGDGSGAMSTRGDGIPENAVLSNRDKAQDSRERGQDSRWLATEQHFDSSANQRSKADAGE